MPHDFAVEFQKATAHIDDCLVVLPFYHADLDTQMVALVQQRLKARTSD